MTSPEFAIYLVQEKVYCDYRKALGRTFHVKHAMGYIGEDCVDVDGDMVVQVVKTDKQALYHTVSEWMDPYWDVRILKGPPLAMTLRHPWIYGISYCLLDPNKGDDGGIRQETFKEKIQRWVETKLDAIKGKK